MLQPAFGRLAFWLGRRDAQQGVHADAEGVRHLGQHFPTRRRAAQFPKADVGRVDAELFGQLDLRQSRRLPQFGQAQAQRRAIFFAHGRIIIRRREIPGLLKRKSLHQN